MDAAEGEGEIVELDEQEDDCAPKRLVPEPGEPTREQVEDHRTTHLPYRSWCETCVQGRGAGEQHRSGPLGKIPVIACDYLLVTQHGICSRAEGAEPSEILLKILVVKDSLSK